MKFLTLSRAIAALCLIAFAAPTSAQVFNSNPTGAPDPYGLQAPAVTQAPSTGTNGVTSVAVGTSSAQALAAGARAYVLALQNTSATAQIACALGATAALNSNTSFMIGPGNIFTFNATYIPQDAINCIASVASTPLWIIAK